jgi:hypothetical protein
MPLALDEDVNLFFALINAESSPVGRAHVLVRRGSRGSAAAESATKRTAVSERLWRTGSDPSRA